MKQTQKLIIDKILNNSKLTESNKIDNLIFLLNRLIETDNRNKKIIQKMIKEV